ncbi:MAG TPA: NAD-dependent epimerase/dehydratase family protein [Candidatus Limnocylindria bacterium]|nr:NAD-dependent epimerase/dehydratase family protein [Candidatus Limnocylindria bacterium]
MSRVLVTGGAGFIGSFVVDRLRAAGHEAVIFDLRRSPHHARGEVPTVIGDVLDPEALRAAAAGCDAIAHLAAVADVGEVAAKPEAAEHLNARGTLNVLEAARAERVRRVLYASTIWVYSDTEGQVDEDTPLRAPVHLYTATKLAGELYCRSYSELFGVDTTILRFGIPYGPRARPGAVVPRFVRRALDGEPLAIAGSGEQSRRFVYVEDLAEGVVRALAPVAANRTYNLVGGEETTVGEIASAVRDLVGDVEITHTEGRACDFGGADVSGARAEHELGWRAETAFEQGVQRCVAWEQAQRAGRVADVRKPLPARPSLLRSRTGVAIAAALAGALATLLNRIDLLTDPASLLGIMVLLGVPLALGARVDWAHDRARAGLLAGAMVAGALLVAFGPATRVAMNHARHHALLVALMLVASLGLVAARITRRAGRAGPRDTA